MTSPTKKTLRSIAHHLQPVVTVADNGLSDGVQAELDRALTDHELIKVRLSSGDREDRNHTCQAICDLTQAEIVQKIGKVVVLYRHNPQAEARLSNVRRFDA